MNIAETVPTTPARAKFDHCTPLIVEDDRLYATLLVEAFKRNGVPASNLRVVPDGEAATVFLSSLTAQDVRAELPSVVILDLFLRRQSGLAVLSWMKSHPSLEKIPVAVLTGTKRPEDDARAVKLGVLYFLEKPLDFPDLIGIARRILAACEDVRDPAPATVA